MAKRIADVIDLARYRRRKLGPGADPVPGTRATCKTPSGTAMIPFMAPVASYCMPVWTPVLLGGSLIPDFRINPRKDGR
ncbi:MULTISPECIES: hypothetical protein [Rhodomicrobium]|uniref:hypothetical protein n=1 Tax=Rhodomicrobium TaxID=1068 RepID=UPI000B4BECEC|nr:MULTISPECIES: hypothetical protein [Rhodomicrobium]